MHQPLQIIEINPALIEKIRTSPVNLHQHNYEELIVLLEGRADHVVDFDREEIVAPLFVYVSKGRSHQFLPADDARGWIILYENEWAPDTRFHFYSNFSERVNYSLQWMECVSPLSNLCRMMWYEYDKPVPQYAIIKHMLAALLLKLEAESSTGDEGESDGASRPQRIAFHNFLRILEENYKRAVGMQFFADKMNTSLRNLNMICQNVFHKSVSEIVENRRLIEAKRMLMNSELSVSEIGFELGYNEKSYFTRVFSKKMGETPSDFRLRMKEITV